MAAGTLWLLVVGPDVTWWRDVAPGLTVFGLGLALMVAPLTATVLAAAPDEVTGIASGINNAVARAGSLLAVAALPMAVGLAGDDYRDPGRLRHGVRLGDDRLRRAARARRAGLVVRHSQPDPHTRLPKVCRMRVRRGAGVAAAAALGPAARRVQRAGTPRTAPDPSPTSETSSAEPSKTPVRPGRRPGPRRRPSRRARRPALERRHPRAVGQAARRRPGEEDRAAEGRRPHRAHRPRARSAWRTGC